MFPEKRILALRQHIAHFTLVRLMRNRFFPWCITGYRALSRPVKSWIKQNLEKAQVRIEQEIFRLGSASYKNIARDVAHVLGRPSDSTVLYISHNWGGGTQRYINDRVAELRRLNRDVLIVFPAEAGSTMARLRILNGMRDLKETSRFDLTASPKKLRRLIRALKIDAIEVHSTGGWSSKIVGALPKLCQACTITYKIMIHDYIILCPTSLVNNAGIYCGEPDAAQCAICISNNDKAPYTVHPDLLDKAPIDIRNWRLFYGRFLKGAAQVLAPSPDAAQRIHRYYPDIPVTVEPHRENLTTHAIKLPRFWATGERLKVVAIGFINRHKGFDVLTGCARDAKTRGLALDFAIIGHTPDDEAARNEGITVTGSYHESEVYDVLEAQLPHLAFLPSVWLETYGYTLSVALAARLPTVVFDLGAQAERVKEAAGHGLCLPFSMATRPDLINDALLRFARDIASVKAN